MSSGFREWGSGGTLLLQRNGSWPVPTTQHFSRPFICKFNGNQKAAGSREHSPNYAVSLWLSAHHQDLLIFALKAPPTTVIRKMLKVSRTLEVKQLFVSAIYLIALPSCLLKETLP